jgi:hypothetical protein
MARDSRGVLRELGSRSLSWFHEERRHGSPYIAWGVVLAIAAVTVLVVIKLVEAVLSVILILLLVAVLVLVVIVASSTRRR